MNASINPIATALLSMCSAIATYRPKISANCRSSSVNTRVVVHHSTMVPAGSTVTLTGTARAGAVVDVWFHRRNVPGYSKRRTLTADAAGRWSTTYVAVDDHRYYAVSYGLQSEIGLTRIPH